MAIKKGNYGVHEDILIIEFGTGDIEFTQAKEPDTGNQLLFFRQGKEGDISRTSDELVGKTTDEVPDIKMIMSFSKPASITALIHSLAELQEKFFKQSS